MLNSPLSSKSFHRDANSPLGCKQAEVASSLGKYLPFSPKGISEQKRGYPSQKSAHLNQKGPRMGPGLVTREWAEGPTGVPWVLPGTHMIQRA